MNVLCSSAGDLPPPNAPTRAALEFPDFAEAHASLGAVRQLRGAFTEAEASYREAARLRPDLPGLRRNLDVVKQQLDSGTESQSP